MSFTYAKLSSDIIFSSVWCEPMPTKIVWITLLAMADQYGRVGASIPGLAKVAGVSVDEAETAIHKFLAPDPYSRTPDHEGRRIEAISGGWRVLNYENKREQQDEEYQRRRNARNVAAYRERQKGNVSVVSGDVSESHHKAEAEAIMASGGGGCSSSSPADVCVSQKKEEALGENPRQRSAAQAEAEKFSKSFSRVGKTSEADEYVPSEGMHKLASYCESILGAPQSLDFNAATGLRALELEAESPEDVKLAFEYVINRDTKKYWLHAMGDEDEGRGGLKVFVRGYPTILEQAKSKGKMGRVAAKPAKPMKHKASSVDPAINKTVFEDEGAQI